MLASQLTHSHGVFTDFIAAIARVYTGSQAITNHMLALASRNIDRDWSGPAIEQVIKTQRETLAHRRKRFAELTSRGMEGRSAAGVQSTTPATQLQPPAPAAPANLFRR